MEGKEGEKQTLTLTCTVESKEQDVIIQDGVFKLFMSELGIKKSAYDAMLEGLIANDSKYKELLDTIIRSSLDRVVFYAESIEDKIVECRDVSVFGVPILELESASIVCRLNPILDQASSLLECAVESELGSKTVEMYFREGEPKEEFSPMVLLKGKVSNPNVINTFGVIYDRVRDMDYILPLTTRVVFVSGNMVGCLNKFCEECTNFTNICMFRIIYNGYKI